jgi:flagellar biosynthesis chaperone FliJ
MGITSKKVLDTLKKDREHRRIINDKFLRTTPLVDAKIFSIEDYEDEQYEVCNHFGCGRRLTHTESLYSKYCFIHNQQYISEMETNLNQLTEELKTLHLMRKSLMNKWAECNRQNSKLKELLEKIMDADFSKIGMSTQIKEEIKTLFDSLIT